MGLKSKVLAAAATLTLVGGVSTVGMMSASAATPSCGGACVDLFSRVFGTHRTPNFVLDVWRQGAKVGQPIILFRTSDTDPAEDINASFQGFTSDFFGAGLVSAAVELHYGAGLGLPTTRPRATASRTTRRSRTSTRRSAWAAACASVLPAPPRRTPRSACSRVASRRRLSGSWTPSTRTIRRGYVPLINGSDTNFSHPFVLTYPSNGYPTDKPRPQLITQNLTGFTGNFLVPVLGTVNDNQLWGADFGVLR